MLNLEDSINHIMLVLNRHQYHRYFDQSLQDTEPLTHLCMWMMDGCFTDVVTDSLSFFFKFNPLYQAKNFLFSLK